MKYRVTTSLSLAVLGLLFGSAAFAQRHAANPAVHAGRLALVQRVNHSGVTAREPMVVQLPNGTLFAAGYGGPWAATRPGFVATWRLWRSRLWKSTDGGATWSRVNLGPDAAGKLGDSDVDLAVAPDGTIYFVSMTFEIPLGEGSRIAIGVSHDMGTTWRWTVLDRTRFDDRPWVKVAPDGVAHVIWNDGRGVEHVMSRDGGATWTKPARVSSYGGSSHLAVGPHGDVAVRIAPLSASGHGFFWPAAEMDLVAVSTDGGATWRLSAAPGRRDWLPVPDYVRAWKNGQITSKAIPRWVEPLAWDGKGRLYSLWGDSTGVMLARSTDRGTTWKTWRIFAGGEPCFYPYLIARGDGQLAATWFCARHFDSLRWQAALIHLANGTDTPHVALSQPLELDAWQYSWRHPDSKRPWRDTGGEYLGVTFLKGGGIGIVTPIQAPVRSGFTWWRFVSRSLPAGF